MPERIKGGTFDIPGYGRITFPYASAENPELWEGSRLDLGALPVFSPTQALELFEATTKVLPAVNLDSPDLVGFSRRNQILKLVRNDLVTPITTRVARTLNNIGITNKHSLATMEDEIIKRYFGTGSHASHVVALRTLAQEEVEKEVKN